MGLNSDHDGVSLHIEADNPDSSDQPPKDIDESTSMNGSGGGSRDGDKDEGGERGAWGGKLEFIFTCVGYAVGLGNVWRFPYLCYKNGGGAFLLPYVLMLCVVGLPLFFMELAFGQFASLGPITVWKVNRLLKGLGYAMVSVAWLMSVYYNVIIAHILLFLFESLASIATQLPWITCDNYWNTPNCLGPVHADLIGSEGLLGINGTGNGTANGTMPGYLSTDSDGTSLNVTNATIGSVSDLVSNSTAKAMTAAEEYYMNYILEQSDGMETPGPLNWKVSLCLLLAWCIVLVSLIKGIQSLGKVVYFTAIFPYVMLIVMLVRSVTLPGSLQGIIYYLAPDFSRLQEPRVWSDAATQIFYSLGTCTGGLVAMSSYNKFHNNCLRDAVLVAFINCGTSILAGFVIFAVLGFMALEKGVSVSDVAAGGPGLAFVVYPEALSRMPGSQFWAILFFLMMATLGFGSQLSFVETVLSAFTDEFPGMLRGKYPSFIWRCSVIIFTFLLGLPMCTTSGIYMLNLVDYSLSGFPLLIVGVMEIVAINWIYGFNRFAEDIEIMMGKRPNIYWQLCWKLITPLIILITIGFNMFVHKAPTLDHYEYPVWAQHLGFCIAFFPVSLIIFFFLWSFCRTGGFKLLTELSNPKPEWGPALPSDRTGRYADTGTQETGTQSDFTTMWTQTRVVLARTPMPSMLNLTSNTPYASTLNLVNTSTGPVNAGTPCSMPLGMGVQTEDVLSAVEQARQARDGAGVVEVLPGAAGTPDIPFLRSTFLAPVSSSLPTHGTVYASGVSSGFTNTPESSANATTAPMSIPGMGGPGTGHRGSVVLSDIPEGKPLETFEPSPLNPAV